MMREYTIVDATFIASPRSTKNKGWRTTITETLSASISPNSVRKTASLPKKSLASSKKRESAESALIDQRFASIREQEHNALDNNA